HRIFSERLDSAGASLRRNWLYDHKKFEVVEFFELLSNSSLEFTAILMEGNIINDAGAMAMASYIAKTKVLQVLEFPFCLVTEKGMRLILNSLKCNTSILQINLRDNEVTPAIGLEILDIVKHHNHTIRQMVLKSLYSLTTDS